MDVKVLDLQCETGHRFEGWFQNEDDFLAQKESKRLLCPMCDSPAVNKLPTSARLNLRSARSDSARADAVQAQESQSNQTEQEQEAAPTQAQAASATDKQLAPPKNLSLAQQRKWLQGMRAMVNQTEDVGEQFTDMALRMHREEIDEKPIRGRASGEQVQELLEEGVALLPLPAILKEPIH